MKSNLLGHWHQLTEKINQLSVRERLILATTLVTGIGMSIQLLLIDPALARLASTRSELTSVSQALAEQQTNFKVIQIEYSADPNEQPRQRLRELTHQLRRVESSIQAKSQHLVPASQTASVLQDILKSQQGLYLVNLEKQAPIPVKIISEAAAPIPPPVDASNSEFVDLAALLHLNDTMLKEFKRRDSVYRHGIKMELEGSFTKILDYLVALEQMESKVYWKSFEYTAGDYPSGRASFMIETLGFESGWIGSI